jgi:glycosyltransferase involved in cell wall biosynthesis
MRLGLPWRLPFYKPLNGPHPLVESFVRDHPRVGTVDCDPAVPAGFDFTDRLLPALCRRTRLIAERQTRGYVIALDPLGQACIEAPDPRYDALFTHTTPLYLGAQPWIFHFESIPTVFHPFLETGNTAGVALRKQGFFSMVAETLASASCRAIFTHMQSSRDIMARLFDDPRIDAKLHHVPLGIDTLDDAAALGKFAVDGPLRILFTNSLHQNPISFFLRGGHHLLQAYGQLRAEGVDVELTVISSLPDGSAARAPAGKVDGLTWIQERVSDAELGRLLREHHLFALPAAGLHSFSLLRALAHGCVPIVSDALGYEEYTSAIADSVFPVRGVRSLVYRDEPDGWVSDRYAEFLKPSADFSGQIRTALLAARDRLRLRAMAGRNLAYCRQRHDPALAQDCFYRSIRGHFPEMHPA